MSEENTNIENNETTETEQQETTFSQSEVDSRISKAVDSALKKQQAKLEQQKVQEIEQAKKDAEEYSRMTAKEKEDAEYQKRIDALEQREKELNNRQLLSEIEADLKDNSLPVEFALSLLSIQDNEKIKESIKGIKSAFDDAVKEQVKEALRQDTPKGSTGDAKGLTKEQFNQLSYTEKVQIYKEQPDLYNQFK